MSLNDIVQLSITRETQSVTRAGFGTYGFMSEFATDKTTVAFNRYRKYASLSEMITDGWLTTDVVYKAAQVVFSQNPKLSTVFIGRKDAADADWATALTAINNADRNWYMFGIEATPAGTVVFSDDFVTDNSIAMTVNGESVTAVAFNSDQATTMDDLKDQIEADIAGSSVTILTSDTNTRSFRIDIFGETVTSITAAVTGGASQPTAVITYINEDDYEAVSAWVESAEDRKAFLYASSSSGILVPETTDDIASTLKALNLDRTVSIYHPSAQGVAYPQFLESGWPGECLPYDPGTQTWAYKTIAGVSSYALNNSQRSSCIAKNCNFYTEVAGIDITETGKVAGGEWLDIIRGIDALEARIQEDFFRLLTLLRKLPFDDGGITLAESTLRAALNAFAGRPGLLIADSIVITVPKYSDTVSADKIDRVLPDLKFTATPQGAIHILQITGTVAF